MHCARSLSPNQWSSIFCIMRCSQLMLSGPIQHHWNETSTSKTTWWSLLIRAAIPDGNVATSSSCVLNKRSYSQGASFVISTTLHNLVPVTKKMYLSCATNIPQKIVPRGILLPSTSEVVSFFPQLLHKGMYCILMRHGVDMVEHLPKLQFVWSILRL